MNDTHVTILICTLAHILLWVFAYRLRARKLDLFDPFYLISALYIMIFVYGPWVWINNSQTSYQGIEVMKYLPKGTLVFNIGYFFFSIGALARIKFVKKQEPSYLRDVTYNNKKIISNYYREPTRIYIIRYATILYIFSLGLTILYYQLIGRSFLSLLSLGSYGTSSVGSDATGLYILRTMIRSTIPASLLLLRFSKRKFFPSVMAIILCIICISTGSRNLAITVILAIFVEHYLEIGKRPKNVTVLLLIICFYLLIGIIGIFRETIKNGQGINWALISSEKMRDAFMYNVEIFFPFYHLVAYIPSSYPYHYGLGFLNIVVQFIPRAIWHSKPAMLGKSALEVMYGSSLGGAAYPNIGEFYYEFGLIGVVLLMYAFGYIMKRIYEKSVYETDCFNILRFSIIFGYIIQFVCRGHIASWAIDYILMLAPIGVLRYLLKNRRLI